MYSLTKEYGADVTFYRLDSAVADPKTGDRTITKTAFNVKKAIVLPATVAREQVRSISAISANKQLVQGGWYDAANRYLLVDKTSLPVTPTLDDWFVFQDQQWEVKEIRDFEFGDACWWITVRALEGVVPEQIHIVQADSLVSMNDASEC